MELDFELNTILITMGMWIFILFLVWGVEYGFSGLREKIIMTVASLPIIYFIVVWQKGRID